MDPKQLGVHVEGRCNYKGCLKVADGHFCVTLGMAYTVFNISFFIDMSFNTDLICLPVNVFLHGNLCSLPVHAPW